MSNVANEFRDCDLDNEEEIFELVKRFYRDVAQDHILGPIFNDVAKVNWDEHIPKIALFWNKILLGKQGYVGDPMGVHMKIHALHPFTHEHFRRWLEMFQLTVDQGWEGPYAEEIKRKAVKIGLVHSRHLIGEPLDVLLHVDKDTDS